MSNTVTRRLLIDMESSGTRLDLFVTEHFSAPESAGRKLSRSEIQRLISAGQITLNGVKAKASTRIRANDRIDVQFLPSRDTVIRSEALPLDVLYEDEDWIVINKAPGLTVHPAAGHWSGTLVNALLHHCPGLEGIGGERRPGIVHRLDKDTSGVMIVAKNMAAYHGLVDQFKDRTVKKEYVAVAWGKLTPETGVIDRPIGRHRSDRKKMSSLRPVQRSRTAVTGWKVERHFMIDQNPTSRSYVSLLRLFPRTGRTHQLRVHLADAGYPLVGDRVYGKQQRDDAKKNLKEDVLKSFPRQALHAQTLVVTHGRTGKRMKFSAPLPSDFLDLLGHLHAVDVNEPVSRG